MKKSILFLALSFVAFLLNSCDDEKDMLWEVVSNSNPELIQIVNESTEDFDRPSAIWVRAGYMVSGDVVLKCVNHSIELNDAYTNPAMGFTLSKLDANTIKIHFEERGSGNHDATDQIAIINSDTKDSVLNTLFWISRIFDETDIAE